MEDIGDSEDVVDGVAAASRADDAFWPLKRLVGRSVSEDLESDRDPGGGGDIRGAA